MGSGTFVTVGYFEDGSSAEFVRRLKPEECHMYCISMGSSTFVSVFFLIPLRGTGGEYYFVHCVHAMPSHKLHKYTHRS